MKTYNERRKIKLTYFALMLGLLITTPPVFGDLTKQIDTFSISLKALKLKLVDLAGKIQTVKEKLTVPTKSKDEIFKDLYQACLRENLEALKQMAHLITPEIVNTKDGNSTPLETMVSMKAKNLDNRIAMINILIDKGAPVDTKDKSNRTLLHLIVSSKTNNLITNLAIIELLIKKGANVNAKENIQQDTPLHLACEEPNNEEIIKVLLAHKANPLIKNALNKTPIDIAKASGNPEYIALLISDEEIEKALNEACQSGDLGILDDYPKQIKPEIINKKQGPGKTTFLHRAIDRKHLNVVKFLIQNGADINAVNNGDNTPLHIACLEGGNEEIITFLIEKNANLEAINIMKMAPLAYAAFSSHPEYTQVLTPAKENCPICSEDYGPNSFYKLTCCSQKICLRCFIKLRLRKNFERKNFECPLCRKIQTETLDFLKRKYDSKFWENKTWNEFEKIVKDEIQKEAQETNERLENDLKEIRQKIIDLTTTIGNLENNANTFFLKKQRDEKKKEYIEKEVATKNYLEKIYEHNKEIELLETKETTQKLQKEEIEKRQKLNEELTKLKELKELKELNKLEEELNKLNENKTLQELNELEEEINQQTRDLNLKDLELDIEKKVLDAAKAYII